MFKRTVATLVCAALVTSGCASAGGPRFTQPQQAPRATVQDSAALGDYVQRIAAGSRVRVERSGGDVLRGILMKATADSIVVQKNTRVPDKPVEIPLSEIARVSLDAGSSSMGKTVAVGMAAGAAGTLAVFLTLVALYGSD